jgi:hypothetical protein
VVERTVCRCLLIREERKRNEPLHVVVQHTPHLLFVVWACCRCM